MDKKNAILRSAFGTFIAWLMIGGINKIINIVRTMERNENNWKYWYSLGYKDKESNKSPREILYDDSVECTGTETKAKFKMGFVDTTEG